MGKHTTLEGDSWYDGEVVVRGIRNYLLWFVHSQASTAICQVGIWRSNKREGKTKKKRKGGGEGEEKTQDEGGRVRKMKGGLCIIWATVNKTREPLEYTGWETGETSRGGKASD